MPSHGYLLPTRGVVLSSSDPLDQTAKTLADIIGTAKRAESLGFDSLWVGDSVLAKPRLEPLSTLSAVAAVTDAVTLGTAVYLPNLRNPVNVAHQVATLDQLSGGRFVFGVGVGSGTGVEDEHVQLDVPFHRRGALLDEFLKIATGLWSGSVDYTGEFYTLDAADIGLRPCRKPPIYIASAGFDPTEGFPTTIEDRVRRWGDGWLPIWMSPEEYAAGIKQIRTGIENEGGNPDRIDAAYYQEVVIADSEPEALAEARDFLHKYYPDWSDISDERLHKMGAFGPPEAVQRHLNTYREAGVETFITRFPARNQREQLQSFSRLL